MNPVVAKTDRLRDLRARAERLRGIRDAIEADKARTEQHLEEVRDYLSISSSVSTALDHLGEALFGRVVEILERNLSLALRDVLEQPMTLKVTRGSSRGSVVMSFEVEKDGDREDILKGQGGALTNVLSVCLRIFALTTLDPKRNRRFLVLDEQDCWVRPDLVPRLVKIVHEASRTLGFQFLLISHHQSELFEKYADRIFELVPEPDGVRVVTRDP